MKRRRFVQAFVAAPALLGQQQPPPPGVAPQPASAQPVEPPASETKIEIAIPDVASEPMPHFFTPQQFAALRKLSDILMPAANGVPGALDAKAPEFLDFLIGHSPADRQHTYRTGLDALNAKAFTELGPSDTVAILSPLREPWTYDPPADPLARFLLEAKQDVRTATVNSREYSAHAPATGRRFGGSGLYWYPLD
jgi:Gluconate 2-dehydrogenase subunit 3